ncbi:secretin receptor [Trichinella spiralis]|uniref:secretin receptor n=1 Tax=Trichinella spiralis TaxID=6334 RepID=UPI0001EFC431|nr:secretin receptor [Trichinella spiralis]
MGHRLIKQYNFACGKSGQDSTLGGFHVKLTSAIGPPIVRALRYIAYYCPYTLPLKNQVENDTLSFWAAGVGLTWLDMMNVSFVLLMATWEMTPSLSMVITLSDLSSTLYGPEWNGAKLFVLLVSCTETWLYKWVLDAMPLPRWPEMAHRRSECLCERRRVAARGGASPTKKSAGKRKTEPYNTSVVKQLMSSFNAYRRPLDPGAVHVSNQGCLGVAVEPLYDAIGLRVIGGGRDVLAAQHFAEWGPCMRAELPISVWNVEQLYQSLLFLVDNYYPFLAPPHTAPLIACLLPSATNILSCQNLT